MPQTRTDPEVIQVLREHRAALIAREEDQTIRLATSWLKIEQSLNDEMLLLALQIQDEQAKGSVITEQLLRRMDRYQKLNSQMKTEILKYSKDVAEPDIEKEQFQYGLSGIQSASEAIRLTAGLGVQFDKLPVDAIETYVGYLSDGTPLNRLLKEAYPDALDGVVKAFLDGAARGLNPNAIALNASRSMGMGLERITLIARTEQLQVSRNVSAQQYRESGLDGYMRRVATKDANVCMACLILDSQIIPLNQELDDHPRGRCVAVFQINKAPVIQWEKGQDWFMRQEESLQRQMMGNDKFELWKDGEFKLEDMAKIQENKVWGDSPRVATIGELIGSQEIKSDRQLNTPVDEGNFVILPDGGIEWVPSSSDIITPASNIVETELVSNKEADELINRLSPEMQTVVNQSGVSEIRIVTNEEMQAITETARGATCVGLHLEEDNSILILNREIGMERALIHEIAHALDLAGEDGKYKISESKEWLDASGWKLNKKGEYVLKEKGFNNLAPTQYAKQAPWEDFAESFAQANGTNFDRRVMMGESEKRYEFIKNLMKENYGIDLNP